MKKEINCGTVFAIEEFSVFDGPGLRTTVFLKGCPLSCSWCHNPEGKKFESEIIRSSNGCINCGLCKKKALELTGEEKAVKECIEVCPRNLLRVSGEYFTPLELTERLLKNALFYSFDGGVTFSGGEPLSQPHFLKECLKLLKGKVHRCVQTSGYCSEEVFKTISEETDLFLFDIKVVDRCGSLRYTGVDNTCILNNLSYLVNSGKDFIIRIPLIPGVTDTEKNICDIIALLKKYRIAYAEALPYNKMAGAKYKACDKIYCPDFDSQKEANIPRAEFENHGIELKIL